MVKVTAAEVNKLRKTTGAGMMDCKKALVESNGDFDAAIEILRKKGQKVAAKRADSCLLYTSPSPRDQVVSRMPSSA